MIHKTFENNKHNIECMILTGVLHFSTPENDLLQNTSSYEFRQYLYFELIFFNVKQI